MPVDTFDADAVVKSFFNAAQRRRDQFDEAARQLTETGRFTAEAQFSDIAVLWVAADDDIDVIEADANAALARETTFIEQRLFGVGTPAKGDELQASMSYRDALDRVDRCPDAEAGLKLYERARLTSDALLERAVLTSAALRGWGDGWNAVVDAFVVDHPDAREDLDLLAGIQRWRTSPSRRMTWQGWFLSPSTMLLGRKTPYEIRLFVQNLGA